MRADVVTHDRERLRKRNEWKETTRALAPPAPRQARPPPALKSSGMMPSVAEPLD